jgi:hypothetical protein
MRKGNEDNRDSVELIDRQTHGSDLGTAAYQ